MNKEEQWFQDSTTLNLENRIKNVFHKSKLPENKESMKKYLKRDHLGQYFEGIGERQKNRYTKLLEDNIDKSFDKYHKSLDSMITKSGKVAGVTIAGLQVVDLLCNIPVSYSYGASVFLIGGKTVIEIPKVYDYMKKSADMQGVYGLVKYGLKKVLSVAVPFVGPLIEGTSLKKMLLERVMYESKKNFLKDIGQYKSLYGKVKERIKSIAGEIKPKIQPVYQFA